MHLQAALGGTTQKGQAFLEKVNNRVCQDGQERASKPIPLLAPTTAIVFPSIPTFAISVRYGVFQGLATQTYYRSC